MTALEQRQQLLSLAHELRASLTKLTQLVEAALESEADGLLSQAVEEASDKKRIRPMGYRETMPKKRKPLSEATKAKLRANIAKARAARKAKKNGPNS